MPLALTRTRLKGFITLQAFPGGAFVADPNTIADYLKGFKIVGSCQQLSIVQTRETNSFRREFSDENTESGGIPAETYPGLPSFSATLHRVDLYEANMLETFGFNDVNIASQYAPMIIMIEQPVPTTNGLSTGTPLSIPGGRMKRRSYYLDGCWFNNMPIEFNITDADQKFVQEAEITFRNIQSFTI